MKRALANFFRWLADLNDPPSAPAVPATRGQWTPEAAQRLAVFLQSNTGQALSEHLRLLVAANAIDGARKSAETNTVTPACIAAGWDEAVRYFHSLSRVSRVPDTKTDDKLPPGEAEWLEQLSP